MINEAAPRVKIFIVKAGRLGLSSMGQSGATPESHNNFENYMMRKVLLFGLMSLFIAGCATDAMIEKERAQANITACQDKSGLAVACADTVTATFAQDGKLWLAWVKQDHVYVQSSTDKGKSFSQPVQVNKVPEPIIAHDEYRPKIQLDSNGNIYLTWTRSLEKRHTGNIRFSRSSDGGNTFSDPVTVNDNLDIISHRFDGLLVGKNGEIFIAWLDARDKEQAKASRQEFLGTSLYYTWSSDGGKSFYPNKQAAPHTCECCRLAIALDVDNLPVVMWRHVFPGNIRDHAVLKFSDWHTPGTLQRASQDNWQIDACPHHGPSLAIAEDATYHAAWFSGAESHQGLFYARSEDQGKTFVAQKQFGGLGAKHPHVAALGQRVVIVWMEFDGSNTIIKSMRSLDGGENWLEPEQLALASGTSDYAFVVNDESHLYLSWQSSQGYHFQVIN
jgi:BNR/Asp-box repeat.